jgi:hypothetical protein
MSRRAGLIALFFIVSGCGHSDGAMNAVGQVAGGLATQALSCQIGQCPDSPRTYLILHGRVMAASRTGGTPVVRTRVVLRQGGTPVASASTDAAGRFGFNQDIPDGFYELAVDSDRHQGSTPIVLEGKARAVDLYVYPVR